MAEKTTVTTNNDNPYDHVVMNIHDQFVLYPHGRGNQTNYTLFTTMSPDCRDDAFGSISRARPDPVTYWSTNFGEYMLYFWMILHQIIILGVCNC